MTREELRALWDQKEGLKRAFDELCRQLSTPGLDPDVRFDLECSLKVQTERLMDAESIFANAVRQRAA